MGRLSTRLRGFGRNERAAVALLFGVSAVPFILAAGVALDYGRALDLKTQMQSALDAGALAAAASRNLTDAQRIKLGETAFAANFKSRFRRRGGAADHGGERDGAGYRHGAAPHQLHEARRH